MGSKWIPELITILGYHKSLRFGEFENHLPGISSTVLATKLDKLIEFDYVQRIEYDESPPRVEYHLNENGLNLWDKLQYLQDLAK